MRVLTFSFFLCQTSLRQRFLDEYDSGIAMIRASASRDAWQPDTELDRAAVLRELNEILASSHFCNSKRYPAFLQYIVENTLAGKADQLKERTLGVAVFDRPPTYDTNADTVVRYTAGEVRKRLSLYYTEHGRESRIRISLPAGSYTPEFVVAASAHEGDGLHAAANPFDLAGVGRLENKANEALQQTAHSPAAAAATVPLASSSVDLPSPANSFFTARRVLWPALVVSVALILGLAMLWRSQTHQQRTAVDDFWQPVLKAQQPVLICTGGNVFAQNVRSGTITADRESDYPFVSMQVASAISQVSALLARSGATAHLVPSASSTLADLRDHPIALLGGYNNQWTLRLVKPLRFHFGDGPGEVILDELRPSVRWERDVSLPYSSADDYSLIARYRESATGGWVVVLAGVGRNGTEAAAQFVTSPQYMQQLRDQLAGGFSNRNIEVVLKVNVIDGKTGAPSILAVHSW